MSLNSDLAKIFEEMAAVMEITGANGFRVNAQRRVARVMKDLVPDVASLASDEAKLKAIDGIGAGSAKKIIEFVETGRIAEHDDLLKTMPSGLLELLDVQGLGPKTIRRLWQEADVVDRATLQTAIDEGCLVDLPRMGAKTIANIADSLAFAVRAGERTRIDIALTLAESIIDHLASVPGTQQLTWAGSLRRGRETIGDIDLLAVSTNPAKLARAFCTMDSVTKVLVSGETKCSVRHGDSIQVDLRLVEAGAWGAALLYFTGSKEHNVLLRERAIRMSMRLNEYGLFPADGNDEPPQTRGVAPIAAAMEAEIYRALELPFIPPELREARGELDGTPPDLITLGDIRAELHAHTIASDGHMTIDELVDTARERGFHTIAVTDHSRSSAQANGLSVERLREHIDAVRAVDATHDDIRVLAGSEVDIHADGSLDYDDDILALLDIVVASPHAALRQNSTDATERLVRAIEHPLVHIIGHPTGRVIGRRPGLEPDIATLVAAAAEHDTALEINANPRRLDLRDVHVGAAVAAGALIAIDTDAHGRTNFDLLRYGVLTARRGGLTAPGCINTWDAPTLHTWLANKRR